MALTSLFLQRIAALASLVFSTGQRAGKIIWRSAAGGVVLHLGLFAALASTLYCFGIFNHLPANANLNAWDIPWYKAIAHSGYKYSATETSSVAFFPLFPYFWRFTHLDELGISLLNASLFFIAFAWLAHQFRLGRRWQLLALSSPMLLFVWVPYTEALFFVFSALLLAGLHRGRTGWVLLGLVGAGLTRSASSLFTPALLLTVGVLAASGATGRAWRWGVGGLLALAAATGGVAALQWHQTGEPLGFIKAHKHWGHVLGLPKQALFATTGINMLWLEAVAFTIGLLSLGVCLGLVGRIFANWAHRSTLAYPSPAVVFSLGYAVCATLFILLFQNGNMANLARYIMPTPFMVVLLWQLSQLPFWRPATYALVAAGTAVVWLLFGAYSRFPNFNPGQAMWYFGLISGYIVAYLGWRQWRYGREVLVALYVFNLIIQLHLLDSFLQYYLIE